MKRWTTAVLCLALVVAACGDDAGALTTCDAVAEATVDLVQDVIDEFEAMTPSEAGEVLGGAMTPGLEAIEVRGTEIGTAAEELQCTDLDALVAQKAERLTYDPANGFTALIAEGTRDGEDVLARLFR